MKKVVGLVSCHNRAENTRRCLVSLAASVAQVEIDFSLVLVDDGCTDQTVAYTNEIFPDAAVLTGNGSLFWAGGMRFGWEQLAKNLSFDYLFVFNDDVEFSENSLQCLLDSVDDAKMAVKNCDLFIVSGPVRDPRFDRCSYSGWKRDKFWHPLRFGKQVLPSGDIQFVDVVNMNAVLIPKSVIEKIGFLSDYFLHSGADFEYSLKLKKAGGVSILAPSYVGLCEINKADNIACQSLALQIKELVNPMKEPLYQRYRYYSKYGGFFWPLLFVSPFITTFLRYVICRLRCLIKI